jgi:hypothetical protein
MSKGRTKLICSRLKNTRSSQNGLKDSRPLSLKTSCRTRPSAGWALTKRLIFIGGSTLP